jgi:TIR domain
VAACHPVVAEDPEKAVDFISHAGRDRAWAEWVAGQLRAAGRTVELDVTDWAAGEDFMDHMAGALGRCTAMVALWSQAYFAQGSFLDAGTDSGRSSQDPCRWWPFLQ